MSPLSSSSIDIIQDAMPFLLNILSDILKMKNHYYTEIRGFIMADWYFWDNVYKHKEKRT